MNYRPHIDGLRALAIIFVLVFHAGLSLFPSGFIGVDIFFVISGFLITGIIHRALQTNNFSFFSFYNRRLWRLQPVFLCLLIFTSILSLIFYTPQDLLAFSKSASKTSLFLSNQYFERITNGYFSENINFLPLLHTWSLSIEWQCYLILPLIIYLLYCKLGEKNIAKALVFFTLVFFALSLFYSSIAPAKTYYLFLSRIFEFLVGSSLSLMPKGFAFNRHYLNFISFSALVCLFYLACLPGIHAGFPNFYALILCLATAILIAAGEQEAKCFCIKLLSFKPIVFIGLLSYSLYIWHWPIFVLTHYLHIEETNINLVLTFSLVLIVAYLSWRFIELPSHNLTKIKFNHSFVYLFLAPLIFFHLADYQIIQFKGFPERFPKSERV